MYYNDLHCLHRRGTNWSHSIHVGSYRKRVKSDIFDHGHLLHFILFNIKVFQTSLFIIEGLYCELCIIHQMQTHFS